LYAAAIRYYAASQSPRSLYVLVCRLCAGCVLRGGSGFHGIDEKLTLVVEFPEQAFAAN
jgi:hypothetical protein